MKTQKEVRDYALAASTWLYVWGANGEKITRQLMDRLYRDYGSATYNKAYYDDKLAVGAGKMAADCSGFMMPLSGYDSTAQGYYNACISKGKIGSLPEDKVCLVFKINSSGRMHHIGIYLGDGTVAEMASSATNYQHRPLSATNWTHWGLPKWIDYASDWKDPKPLPTGWIEDEYGWWYRHEDGSYTRDGWEQIGGKRYWFNGDGYAYRCQWVKDKDRWYYLGADNAMVTGFQAIDGEVFYFDASGAMAADRTMVEIVPDERGALH